MNKTIAGVAVVVLVAVAVVAVAAMGGNDDNMAKSTTGSSMHDDNEAPHADADKSSEAVETNEVTYKGFAVVQKSIKIKKGTTVTWTNEDNAKHDVTPDTETADFKATELFGKGETAKITFNTVGKFSYYCSPHPYMKGTIEVVE